MSQQVSIIRSTRGFTIIELLISMTIMVLVFWLLIAIVRSPTFSGNFEEKRMINATKRATSDFNEIFLQYPVSSGAVYTDTTPTKYFDRIGLVYSGGTIIIAVADKNEKNILDPGSNDNGFLGWRAISGTVNVATYTGALDIMSDQLNITNLQATYGSGLLRIEVRDDTEIVNGNTENYASGSLILIKNINH